MWVFLTAGRGPGECQIAVTRLTEILIHEARALGFDPVVIDHEMGPHGFLSALIVVPEASDAFAASWEGSIKWICPSPIRPNHRRKNWFVSVSVIRPPSVQEPLREFDLQWEAFRASGPGGQHVNKTSSAVRLTHLPTGIVTQAQEERSQHRNKALAMARLAAILAERKMAAEKAVEHEKWSKHDALERGNAVRTYRGLAFNRS